MIGVPGIPIITWSDAEPGNGNGNHDEDEIVRVALDVTVTAYIDPDFDPQSGMLPNPAELEEEHADLESISEQTEVSAGKATVLTLREESN
jgi:hypothetical protein